jgi:hypothetical protein
MGCPRGAREARRPIFRRFALGDHPVERYSRQERSASLSLRVRPSRSRWVPRESLDAPEDLPKERRRQVALRQLQDEVSGMLDEPPAGLEQPLLQARQRPALDGERQDQPTQEIPEVIGDDAEQEADLVGPEAVAREARPVGGGFALFDPLFRRPTLVVEVDDGSIRPRERSDDEALCRS